jgi:hypothetical protein
MIFQRIGNSFIDVSRITKVEIVEQDLGPFDGMEEHLEITMNDSAKFFVYKNEALKDAFFKQFFTQSVVSY